MIKYMVRLNAEEREQLLALVNTGRAAAAKLLHARILLKADVSEDGRRWSDAALAEAWDTSESTVHRVRLAFVAWGLETAVSRKPPTGRQYRKLDGAQEAPWLAVTCRAPPEGRRRWTLKLLADKLGALDLVDSISPECVRTTLKKPSSTRGRTSHG
jgi:Homeodomain-like domain